MYDATTAARALARKLGCEETSIVKTLDGQDYLEFTAQPKAETESPA